MSDNPTDAASGADAPATPEQCRPATSVNVLVVGEGAVGKSCLLHTFFESDDDSAGGDAGATLMSATIGVDVRTCVVRVFGVPVKLHVYDTAGSQRFRAVVRQQLARAHAVLLMFDVTQRATFDRLDQWLKDVRAVFGKQTSLWSGSSGGGAYYPVIMVTGNKTDMPQERRTVTSHEGHGFCCRNQLTAYQEVSAFNVQQVRNLMDSLVWTVLDNRRLHLAPVSSPEATADTVSVLLRVCKQHFQEKMQLQDEVNSLQAQLDASRLDSGSDGAPVSEQKTTSSDGVENGKPCDTDDAQT